MRDDFNKWATKLLANMGKFLMIRAYYKYKKIDVEYLKQFTTSHGLTIPVRRRSIPYLMRFFEHMTEGASNTCGHFQEPLSPSPLDQERANKVQAEGFTPPSILSRRTPSQKRPPGLVKMHTYGSSQGEKVRGLLGVSDGTRDQD